MRIDELIGSKEFIWTLEVIPPEKGDFSGEFEEISKISLFVDAVNITDMPGANLKMSSWGMGIFVHNQGVLPIVQYTCRDRNSLALKGDMFALEGLGIENVLVLGGDPPQKDSSVKAVYEMDTVSFIKWISDNTSLCVGAAVNPGADDLAIELKKIEAKVRAGARFFQTQAVYEPDKFCEFMEKVRDFGVPIICGVIPLRSRKMAEFMNKNIPGIFVPQDLIRRIDEAEDKVECGVEIAVDIILQVKDVCSGIHLMPIKGLNVAYKIYERLRELGVR